MNNVYVWPSLQLGSQRWWVRFLLSAIFITYLRILNNALLFFTTKKTVFWKVGSIYLDKHPISDVSEANRYFSIVSKKWENISDFPKTPEKVKAHKSAKKVKEIVNSWIFVKLWTPASFHYPSFSGIKTKFTKFSFENEKTSTGTCRSVNARLRKTKKRN